MWPSDNVLRGGLTPKHVDVPELMRVLDFTDGPVPYLSPSRPSPHVVVYRPASVPSGSEVPFDLRLIDGNAAFTTGAPAIGVVLDGAFALRRGDEEHHLAQGDSVFVTTAGELEISGVDGSTSPRPNETRRATVRKDAQDRTGPA